MAVTDIAPTTAPTPADTKVERLNTASVKRVIEPEERFDWSSLGPGQLISDELLSTAGLDLELDAETRARLSRLEVASILSGGIRFEAVLMAGFSLQIAACDDLRDPRVTYMLHEVGEETRHSRAFARLLEEVGGNVRDPLMGGPLGKIARRISRVVITKPALLAVMILGGEEIPDLIQKLAAEHPETNPLIADVNRYHRMEEARHLAFARLTLPELYAEAGLVERRLIARLAPIAIGGMFEGLVHPGVYRAIGLPAWKTWRDVNRSPRRRALRHEATRPVLEALLDAGVYRPGRIPRGWRSLCGVDAHGRPDPRFPALDSFVAVPAA
jgi:hypothetical protein